VPTLAAQHASPSHRRLPSRANWANVRPKAKTPFAIRFPDPKNRDRCQPAPPPSLPFRWLGWPKKTNHLPYRSWLGTTKNNPPVIDHPPDGMQDPPLTPKKAPPTSCVDSGAGSKSTLAQETPYFRLPSILPTRFHSKDPGLRGPGRFALDQRTRHPLRVGSHRMGSSFGSVHRLAGGGRTAFLTAGSEIGRRFAVDHSVAGDGLTRSSRGDSIRYFEDAILET